MSLVFRIIGGLALVGVGMFFVIKTQWFLQNIGTIEWAEQKLGGGGSHMLYKFLGLVIAFFGFLIATGLWSAFMQGTIGRLFGGGAPVQ